MVIFHSYVSLPEGHAHLIGCFKPTPLKNMSSSDWIIILTIENKIHVPKHQPNMDV